MNSLGVTSEWRKNNPEKCKQYNDKRSANKKHLITEKEWKDCKQYFDNSCAYCGMTEDEHKFKFKKGLHKEHVINDGRNDLKNCIPSCEPCNSTKNIKTFNEFYNVTNTNYSIDKYKKIVQWLRYDYQNYIKPKRL